MNLKTGAGEWIIAHVGVRSPDGKILDIRGLLTEKRSRKFGWRELRIKPLAEKRIIRELRSNFPDAAGFNRAHKLARELWPQLPWRKRTLISEDLRPLVCI